MATFLGRRAFLASSAAFATGAGLPAVAAVPARDKWYRGNLHMHTLLSDGQAFPEEAALLAQSDYRRELAFVLFSAVMSYISTQNA